MFKEVDIARLNWDGVRIAHCRLPPSQAHELVPASEPGAIATGYNGQRQAVVQLANGRTVARTIPRGTIGLTGAEPIYWLRTQRSAEILEISASPELRCEIATALGVGNHADLADMHGWADHHAWAILDRFRAAARSRLALSDVVRDGLVRQLYNRVYCAKFGGRADGWRGSPLDGRRLGRTLEFIEAHVDASLSIAALAAVAAYSPFHFARSFKLTTGWSPHQYVMARRLEHARALLLEGNRSTVESIAYRCGFTNLSHFRGLMRSRLGVLPSEVVS